MSIILTISDYYLPSYKAGGPIRSISNMVTALGGEFGFKVVTSDRDLGDTQPFEGIRSGEWTPVGKAQVLYLNPQGKRLVAWRRLLNREQYDLIYLNSFFSTLTIMTLFLRRIRLIPQRPVMLAVRGELGRGALSIKPLKKRMFLFLSEAIGLYRGIEWHASSRYELADLLSALGIEETSVFVSMVPVCGIQKLVRGIPARDERKSKSFKESGSARIVFLSRIVRKKGLDVALELLSGLIGKIEFDIYGPVEDQTYWKECQDLMKSLPDNTVVHYKGVLHPNDVASALSQYHLFLLPTRNESFGHVILEALCAGCLVLTSDSTAWRGLENRSVGWDIALSQPEGFRKALQEMLDMGVDEFEERSLQARQFGNSFINNADLVETSRAMLSNALNHTQ
jgi:glycosyltransferase involved in cell wall biosynthesis